MRPQRPRSPLSRPAIFGLPLLLCLTLLSCGGNGADPPPSIGTPASSPSPQTPTSGFSTIILKVRPAQFTKGYVCPPFLDFGAPSNDADFLCRTGMAIGHSASSRTPVWVIERLGLTSLNGGIERTDNFRADPDLLPGRRAELTDYVGSGYDRGHMAPAADFTWSNQAMTESFYLSNIAPQNPTLNRGAWAKLEETIRSWVLERNELIVITGPIFGTRDPTIGASPVRIPQAFFKVVFDPFRREAVGFVYPNVSPTTTDVSNYRVPIEQIESLTELSLLSAQR